MPPPPQVNVIVCVDVPDVDNVHPVPWAKFSVVGVLGDPPFTSIAKPLPPPLHVISVLLAPELSAGVQVPIKFIVGRCVNGLPAFSIKLYAADVTPDPLRALTTMNNNDVTENNFRNSFIITIQKLESVLVVLRGIHDRSRSREQRT